MKKLLIIPGSVLASILLLTVLATAKNRTTAIHLTQNLNQGTGAGQYAAECIAVVATETLPSTKGDPVSWKVKNGNSVNNDDVCAGIDKSQVELHFQDDIMGAAAMKVLKSNNGGNINGTVSSVALEATRGPHKYQVFYKGLAAGPDPQIIVDCPGCGPGGGAPKP